MRTVEILQRGRPGRGRQSPAASESQFWPYVGTRPRTYYLVRSVGCAGPWQACANQSHRSACTVPSGGRGRRGIRVLQKGACFAGTVSTTRRTGSGPCREMKWLASHIISRPGRGVASPTQAQNASGNYPRPRIARKRSLKFCAP